MVNASGRLKKKGSGATPPSAKKARETRKQTMGDQLEEAQDGLAIFLLLFQGTRQESRLRFKKI